MRILAGVFIIVIALLMGIIAIITIANNVNTYLNLPIHLAFARALPPLLILFLSILLSFWGSRLIKKAM
jgi:hypothetical protein